jgi:hypothetical protein
VLVVFVMVVVNLVENVVGVPMVRRRPSRNNGNDRCCVVVTVHSAPWSAGQSAGPVGFAGWIVPW